MDLQPSVCLEVPNIPASPWITSSPASLWSSYKAMTTGSSEPCGMWLLHWELRQDTSKKKLIGIFWWRQEIPITANPEEGIWATTLSQDRIPIRAGCSSLLLLSSISNWEASIPLLRPCLHLNILCLTPMFSGPFPVLPAACSWLFSLSKCCRKRLLFLNTNKEKDSLPSLCVFLCFEVLHYHWKALWPLEIFDPSDLWCLGYWYDPTLSLFLNRAHISIHPFIHTYNDCPLYLSHSNAIWSTFVFPYTSFIKLISFPWGKSPGFSPFTPCHVPPPTSLLQTWSPSLHTANSQLRYVFSITYIFKWDDFQ